MMEKDTMLLWTAAGLAGIGALYLYSKQRAEQAKVDTTVSCGMELVAESGLKDVRAKIEEYQGNADCLRLLGEYVEQYHPTLYQQLVMAGEMNNDQAQAALEVDKQEVAMALNMLDTPAVGSFLMTA
jgi:hypothetical protein